MSNCKEAAGWGGGGGEGEGEGSSGTSRGLKNVALTVPNAAVDQYLTEFNDVVGDKDPKKIQRIQKNPKNPKKSKEYQKKKS